jgi:hypothetical protein
MMGAKQALTAFNNNRFFSKGKKNHELPEKLEHHQNQLCQISTEKPNSNNHHSAEEVHLH